MSTISRRQLLALMGAGGVVVAGTCSGLTVLAVLAVRERQRGRPPQVIAVTATPDPIRYDYPRLVRRDDWGARPPDHTAANESGLYNAETNPEGWRVYDPPLSERYQTVVIHHSVVDMGDSLATVRVIQDLHMDHRGWADVAYHYLIGKEGTVYEGRDLWVRGAHVTGYNTGSVGICLLGDFTVESPPDVQVNAAQNLIVWLAGVLALTHIAGHHDFDSETLCPGEKLEAFIPFFAEAANLSLGAEGYIPPENAH